MRVMIAIVIIALMAPQYASSPSSEVMVVDGAAHLLRAARPIADYINDEMIPNFSNIAE